MGLIVGLVGFLLSPFLAPKTDQAFFFFFLHRQNAFDIQKVQLCGLIYPTYVICFSIIPGP